MIWTELHETYLLREILHLQPWVERFGSHERGQCWEQIAAVLNSLEEPIFKVSLRSVRDHYNLMVKKYKKKWEDEEKSSGISPEHTEIDDALLDLIQRFDEADSERKKESGEKKRKTEDELQKAQEIRNMSLETFGDTKKRKGDETDVKGNKRRRSSDTMTYLAEKSEREFQLRQEELKIKERELELQTQQMKNNQQTQQAQLLLLTQQNAAMLDLFKTFAKKDNP